MEDMEEKERNQVDLRKSQAGAASGALMWHVEVILCAAARWFRWIVLINEKFITSYTFAFNGLYQQWYGIWL